MNTSTERDGGTGNVDRIREEIRRAATGVVERFPGYLDMLVEAAVECYQLTAEHSEKRTDINKKFDEIVSRIVQAIDRNRG